MKQKLNIAVAAFLALAFVLTPTLVAATDGAASNNASTSTGNSVSTSSNKTETKTTSNTATNADKNPVTVSSDGTDKAKEARDDRITKLKSDLKIKLTTEQQARLKTRCKPAQAVVKGLDEKVSTNSATRTKAYGELTDRLTALVTKLKDKNIDTAQFETEITQLQAKVATFNTDLAAYKVTLSDLSALDCTTDPTAFQAALTASRTAHDKVVADATAIKTYVNSTVKVTLAGFKTQLETDEKSKSTSNNEGTR